ncbi:MAG: ankyrin repeat domain-containing protein [Flavobacteriales bacterium]|nr:ankyrin repeat domain-containing protein [Flavobacteriales bacterium]
MENYEAILLDRGYDPEMLPNDVSDIFLRACRKGDIPLVKAFLKINPALIFINTKESNPLNRSVESGNIELVTFLVSTDLDIELKDKDGDTAFHTALNWKAYEIADLLLEKGASPTNINRKNISALSVAVRNNLDDFVFKMLEKGVEIDQYAASWTVLEDKPHFLKAFLENGMDPNMSISFSETPFTCQAVIKKTNEALKVLLEHKADPNKANENGWTPWMLATHYEMTETSEILEGFGAETRDMKPMLQGLEAAKNGELDALIKVLDEGLDVNTKNHQGLNLFFWAVSKGHYHLIDPLLERGADPNCVYSKTSAPLTYLSMNPAKTDLMKKLLKAGANPNEGEHGSQALFNAILSENLPVIEMLIEAGADPNTKNKHKENGMTKAVTKDNMKMLELLKKLGTDINGSGGYPPIHAAIYKNRIDFLKWFIAEGADLNAKDKFGETPLMKACKTEGGKASLEALELLLEHGADIHVKNNIQLNALQYAKLYSSDAHTYIKDYLKSLSIDYEKVVPNMDEWTFFGWLETENEWIIKNIIKHGYDINKVHHLPPLIHCSRRYKKKNFKLLLEYGADPLYNGEDTEGALSAAAALGLDEVKLCLAKGADIDYKTSVGRTALTKACILGKVEVVDYLIEKGASINPCRAGFSPLMEAARHDQTDIVKKLLKLGADANIKNTLGKTALDYATEKGNEEITKMLSSVTNIDTTDGEGMSSLFKACIKGDFAAVTNLIERGASSDLVRKDGIDMKKFASYRQEIAEAIGVPFQPISYKKIDTPKGDFFNLIMNQPLTYDDLNAQNYRGDTIMHLAIAQRKTEVVNELLTRGADHTIKNENGDSAWFLAEIIGGRKIKDLFFTRGLIYSEKGMVDKQVGLYNRIDECKKALNSGDLLKTETLINDFTMSPYCLESHLFPIFAAISLGDFDLINLLFEKGVPFDIKRGENTLIERVIRNKKPTLLKKFFAQYESEIKAQNLDLLTFAIDCENDTVINDLVQFGYDLKNISENDIASTYWPKKLELYVMAFGLLGKKDLQKAAFDQLVALEEKSIH